MAETIASLAVRIGADLSDFDKKMKEFKKTFGKVGSQVQQAGKEIGMAFTGAGIAIGAGLGLAANKAMDFEAQMSSIKAVSGATGKEMEKLKDLAIEMGAKTKYSGVEAAQGIEELIKAGVSLDDIMSGGLEASLNLATAGELDLASAAEIASTALNAFKDDGLKMSDAANILAGAANASATSVSELKFGLSAVAAVASSVGMTFEDTSTALAVLAQNGLKGSDAGTSLKTMLMNLQPQTKEQTALFKELGLITSDGANAFYDANGQLKSLDQIAGILNSSMSGLTDQERLFAMETMFGSDAIRAANILFKEGADGVTAMNAAMSNVTAADVAAEKMNNLKGRMEELKGAVETAQISIGNALTPALTILVGVLQNVTDWFNNLSPSTQQFIAIGAALTAGLMILIGVLGFTAMALGAVATAEWAVILPIAGILTAIAAVIAALAGLIIWLVNVYETNETFKNVVISAWQAILNFIMPVVTTIKDFIMEQFNKVAEWWKQIWPDLKDAFINIWNLIVALLKPIIDSIVNIIKISFNLVIGVVKTTWDIIKGVISGALDVIMGLIDIFAGIFTGNWGRIWEGAKKIVSGIWQSITSIIKGGINAVISLINSFINKLNSIEIKVPEITIPYVGTFGGFTIGLPDIPKIPMLAEGGIVSRPTIAMIGEAGPEAVIPLSYLDSMGTNGSTTVIIELDGKTIAKKTFEYLGSQNRIRGAVR